MKKIVTTAIAFAFAAAVPLSNAPAFAEHLGGYPAPTGLTASATGTTVTLTWDVYQTGGFPAGCTQAQEILIDRSFNGGSFAQLTALNVTDTTHSDMNLAEGTYAYRIQAKCNVPAVPSVSPAHPNNRSLFSNTDTAVVSLAPPCEGSPDVDLTGSPLVLWPPNGKLVAVTVMGTVTPQSYCTMPTSLSYWVVDEYGLLTSVNPISVLVAGDGTFSFQISLEASRLGNDLDGRLYLIHVAADATTEQIEVRVPHDQRKK